MKGFRAVMDAEVKVWIRGVAGVAEPCDRRAGTEMLPAPDYYRPGLKVHVDRVQARSDLLDDLVVKAGGNSSRMTRAHIRLNSHPACRAGRRPAAPSLVVAAVRS